jgi:hypothetical protein
MLWRVGLEVAMVKRRVRRLPARAWFRAWSSYGASYLVIVGGLAVAATLVSSRGLWGFAAERFGWSLLPVGYRVRPPRG